ncbi:glutamine--fructose-6-phosphate transaminase (isomerizing) [Eubacterium sp.]|jgi:glucosamine--fructose-6-phosphate aminotransferase (isomerizing)|uniref:glutamine--fructose-6-phosphate transaminase (isomerizing) n=1 Tax=Eubacterium sp. TaxID=142586 RepID=UPI0035215788
MCGIVGYIGERDCTEVLLNSLSKLEYRGYDSAGIAVFENGNITVEKSKGELANLRKKIEEDHKPDGHCGIGHTRWATHGEPSDINSHPHGSKRVSIVHNGIIENYKDIKKFLIGKGYSFISETDTETVAKLLDYYYEGDPIDAIIKTLNDIRGAYALGILFKDFPDKIFAVRKDSPLIIGVGDEENFIASDVPAILQYTRKYYLLEENEIATIKADRVEFCDIHKQEIVKEVKVSDLDMDAAEKGGYEHFMLKEIHEQPTAVKTTIAPRIVNGMPDLSECGLTDEMLKNYRKIFVVACGTACHAGMVGKYVIEKLARTEVTVDIASEFRYRDPIVTPEDLVIVISQSGETADTKAALKLAKERGAKVLAIVNVKGSSIAREADMVLYTHAGPEISVASTKAFSVQMAVMYLLAFEMAYAKGCIDKEECMRLTKELSDIPDVIEETMKCADRCQYVASKLVTATSLLYIGRGLDYTLSMEGSLKLKEISYIHSESYAAGELKHGTISLVTDQMPVISVATQSELLEKMVSNIVEVKSRDAFTITVTKQGTEFSEGVMDEVIEIPALEDILMPLVTVIPLQLIAYYTTVLKGLNVDKPRNLAKSVTVE